MVCSIQYEVQKRIINVQYYLRNLKSSLSNSTTNLYIITTYNTIYSSTMTAIHTSTITIWKMPKKEKKKKRPHPDYIVGEIFNIWH